jgi:poly(3-hydroxybutyrate) depolymerase
VAEIIAQHVCVDSKKIFAVGQGLGGAYTERLACELEGLRGVATNAYRMPPPPLDSLCARRVPYLHAFQHNDPSLSGSWDSVCNPLGEPVASVAEHDEVWRLHHGCRGPQVAVPELGIASCVTITCDTQYVSCPMSGGRIWTPTSSWRESAGCMSSPDEHDLWKAMWEFFQRHAAP